MARTEQLPQEVLESIAQQIGELIGGSMPHPIALERAALDSPPALELGETFAVYVLGADAIASFECDGSDLTALAQPTGRWHHQVVMGREGRAFARSASPQMNLKSADLREFFVSPLAKKIDAAIRWVNANVDGDPLVHLLIVPSYQVSALWLIYDDVPDTKVLIVSAPSNGAGLDRDGLLSSQEFLRALAGERPIGGLTDRGPRA